MDKRKLTRFPYYVFFDNGEIQSLARGYPYTKKAHIGNHGYPTVSLTDVSGRKTTYLVHRLIAEAFLGPCPAGMQVRHLDGNKLNNNVGNLRYGTQSDNEQDKKIHGRENTGERNGNAKYTQEIILEIRSLFDSGVPQKTIAQKLGLSFKLVSAVVMRRRWAWLSGPPVSKYNRRIWNNQGERAGGAKLTDDKVRKMRSMSASHSSREIAEHFGISYSNTRLILLRKAWVHID